MENNKANESGAGNTFTISDHTDEVDAYLLAKCDTCGTTYRCDKFADVVYLQDVGCGGCGEPEPTGEPGTGWQLLFDPADDEALTHNPFAGLAFASPAEILADAEIDVSEI
jgi:hypothetical protein